MGAFPHLLAGVDFSTLPQQVVNGILLGSIYALIALGYTMVYGVLRLINFAHGEVFMLGAYTALFVARAVGFSGPNDVQASSWVNLLMMMFASMTVCAIVGVLIELFAYRPMRNQPRIASLITAIGVSLLLQYGGALVLPNSPQPSIPERVNPYRGVIAIPIVPARGELASAVDTAQTKFDSVNQAFTTEMARQQKEYGIKSEFELKAPGDQMRKDKLAAEAALNEARNKRDASGLRITIPTGQFIMFVTSIGLMLVLRHIVLNTPVGREMRAVSHDFDSAFLMGINVNKIVVVTFMIGSALAGAGAMMNATFLGTPLDTFYGVKPGVKAFVAAVLGGIGNIPGAVLGGLLMGVAETLVVWLGYSSYRDAVALVILIVVLLFRPGGLLGSAKMEKV